MLKAQVDLNRLLPQHPRLSLELAQELDRLRDSPLLQYLLQRLQRRYLELQLARYSSNKEPVHSDQVLFDAGVACGAGKMLDTIDIVLNEATHPRVGAETEPEQ